MELQGKMKGHGCFFKSQDSSRFGGRPRIFATCVEMILQAGNHNLEGNLCDISKEILLMLGLEILLMLGLEILLVLWLEIFTTVTQGQNCSPPPQCRLFSAHQQTAKQENVRYNLSREWYKGLNRINLRDDGIFLPGRPNVARQPWPRYPSGSNTCQNHLCNTCHNHLFNHFHIKK